MKNSFELILILAGIFYLTNESIVTAESSNELLTPFHPISQEQYDAILGLTSGKPVISEARLIASGIAALKGIAAGLGIGFSASWLPSIFSGLVGASQPNTTRDVLNLQDGYPLCVIKPTDDEMAHDEELNDEHDPDNGNSNRVSPIVKCIMVVKQEDDENDEHETPKPTTPPHRPTPTPMAYAHPHPYPYPYSYPWYGGFYAYSPPPPPPPTPAQQHETHDYTPNYRYYPNYYDPTYQQQSKSGYGPNSYHHANMRSKAKYQKSKKRTQNRKPHPLPMNYYDYTAPPTTRRRKTKRDQNSTNNNSDNNYTQQQQHQQQQDAGSNYARITNFPAAGYQPSTYPQISYHSQYPKVAYSTSYNYPSPVYFGTTPQPQYNRINAGETY